MIHSHLCKGFLKRLFKSSLTNVDVGSSFTTQLLMPWKLLLDACLLYLLDFFFFGSLIQSPEIFETSAGYCGIALSVSWMWFLTGMAGHWNLAVEGGPIGTRGKDFRCPCVAWCQGRAVNALRALRSSLRQALLTLPCVRDCNASTTGVVLMPKSDTPYGKLLPTIRDKGVAVTSEGSCLCFLLPAQNSGSIV